MDLKRLKEWLDAMDGLGKAIVALLILATSIWAGVTKQLDPVVTRFDLPSWLSIVVPVLIVTGIALLLLLSFRRFYRSSRLEQPDAFTLRPTSPSTLAGRTDDLAGLLNAVKANRLVLLDGESGCGKSALVSAGLIPGLQSSNDLLPVGIFDWGDDWLRGPLSSAQDALFQSLCQADREKLGWASSPDLAADAKNMAVDLDSRLKAVATVLRRRPLLIADQFDDYQARHRKCFVDKEGNWLSPSGLAKTNRFWALVRDGLIGGRLHLLVITRADTAAGLASVRFLGGDQTATRTLPKVEAEYLRPLLAGIAVDGAQPPVVSNPEYGWHELRERLEVDLKADRAILMQQVRTVLLGLRQLPVLTSRSYRSAGGLQGLGTLVISRSIYRAGDAAGGGEAGIRVVRTLLGGLVLAGGPNQMPKAQRMLLPELVKIVGDPLHTEKILEILQHEEIVRSAEVGNCGIAWQLDHDYLARSVLAEARQADRWAVELRESRARYETAEGLKYKWSALLSMGTLARICWERIHKRLHFHEAAYYVRLSALRPALGMTCLLLIGASGHAWYLNSTLTLEANQLIDRFGGQGERDAVLDIWRAPLSLRARIYELVNEYDPRLERATHSAWPLAHAGFDVIETRKVAQILRKRLEHDSADAETLGQNYAAILARLTDAVDITEAIVGLRSLLEQERDPLRSNSLASVYVAVAPLLIDNIAIKNEAIALRTLLGQQNDRVRAKPLISAYTAVAAQMTDSASVKDEVKAWRLMLQNGRRDKTSTFNALAYQAVATRLVDAEDIRTETKTLRKLIEAGTVAQFRFASLGIYAAIAARLTDPADLTEAATFLRAMMRGDDIVLVGNYASVAAQLTGSELKDAVTFLRNRMNADDFGASDHAFGVVAAHLTDAEDIKAAAIALRERLTHPHYPSLSSADSLVSDYATVAAGQIATTDIKEAADFLRTLFVQEYPEDQFMGALAGAYAQVVVRLTDAADVAEAATFLRGQFQRKQDYQDLGLLARAYAQVVERFTDAADVAEAATFLRGQFQRKQDYQDLGLLARAYASIAGRMTSVSDISEAATFLRDRLEQEPDRYLANKLVNAYAAVTKVLIDRTDDPTQRKAWVQEVLLVAGHPFISNYVPLLAALQQLAGTDFGGNIGTAADWADKTYGIKRHDLRP